MMAKIDIAVIGDAVFPSVKHESRGMVVKERIEGIVRVLQWWEHHKRCRELVLHRIVCLALSFHLN